MIVTVNSLLLVAVCGMLASILIGRVLERLWLILTLVSAGATLVAAMAALAGGADWEWRSEFLVGGEPLHLRIDGISALFLVLLCVVGGAATVYGREYWSESGASAFRPRRVACGGAVCC